MRAELLYFKSSGKWYATGYFEVDGKREMIDIWQDVKKMMVSGCLPGLVSEHSEFYVLVTVPGHPHDHPRLFIPPGLEPEVMNY